MYNMMSYDVFYEVKLIQEHKPFWSPPVKVLDNYENSSQGQMSRSNKPKSNHF